MPNVPSDRAFPPAVAQRLRSGAPLKVLLLVPGLHAPGSARTLRLEHDSLDGLVRRLFPPLTLELALPGGRFTTTLVLDGAEAFEPGRIAEVVAPIPELSELRRRLDNPGHAETAAATLREMLGNPAQTNTPRSVTPVTRGQADFDRLLGKSPAAPRGSAQAHRVQTFIQRIVADGQQRSGSDHSDLATLARAVIDELIRSVLGDTAFRDCERTWRGLEWLCRDFEVEEAAEIHVCGVAPDADLEGLLVDALATSSTSRTSTRSDAASEDGPFDLIAAALDFETEEEIEQLQSLARIGRRSNALLVVKAPGALLADLLQSRSAELHGDAQARVVDRWSALRRAPEATNCMAGLPRLIGRLPYGARGAACDVDGFEELAAAPAHEDFLWINPVFGFLVALSQLKAGSGGGPVLRLADMPMAIFDDGTGDAIKPPSEIYLSERDAHALLENGVVAFQSTRNSNAVTLSGLSTVA